VAGETVITLVGNLVDDPELRFTPSGAAVASFRLASTPRTYDRQTSEFKDGESLFLTCSVWRQAAENVAESLQRGTRVIVSGRLKQRSYETREGEKRTVYEVDVDEVGPSLRSATAKVTRAQRSGAGGFGGDDPWSSGGSGGAGGQGGDQSQGGGRSQSRQSGEEGGNQSRERSDSAPSSPQRGNDPWSGGGSSDEPPF